MQTAEQTTATTTAKPAAPAVPVRPSATIKLVQPIQRAGQQITELQILKPLVGDLRGLMLVEVMNMKTDAVAKLLPRVTQPTILETEVYQMDTVDMISCATEVAIFLTGATVPPASE